VEMMYVFDVCAWQMKVEPKELSENVWGDMWTALHVRNHI
jgi:hypothetical protein